MRALVFPVLAAALAAPSLAAAQTATLAASAPAPEAGRSEDPNLDRGFFMPTASTQPAGSITVSNYELLVFGLTVGLTDRLQVSETIFPALPFSEAQLFLTTLKWQVARGGRWRLAALGGLAFIRGETYDGPTGKEVDATAVLPQIGGVVSYCLTDACRSLVSVNTQVMFGSGGTPSLVYSASLTGQVFPHVKVLAEVLSGTAFEGSELAPSRSGLFSAGVRVHNRTLAADLGLASLIDGGGYQFPLPFLNVTARF